MLSLVTKLALCILFWYTSHTLVAEYRQKSDRKKHPARRDSQTKMAAALTREGKSDSGSLAFFPGRVNSVYLWVHRDPSPFVQGTSPIQTYQSANSSQIPLNVDSSRPRGVKKMRYESMKHFTCAFWARGGCKFSQEQCLYSHQHGHRLADVPTVVRPGCKLTLPKLPFYRDLSTKKHPDPASVQKPMPSFIADRDSVSLDESSTPKPKSPTPKPESSTPKPESSKPRPGCLKPKPVLRIQTTGLMPYKSAPSRYTQANQSVFRQSAPRQAPMPAPSQVPKEAPRKTLTVEQVSEMYGYRGVDVITKAHLDSLPTKGLGIFFGSTPEDSNSTRNQANSAAEPTLTKALGSDLTQAIGAAANLDVGPNLGQRQSQNRSHLEIQGSCEVRRLLCQRASALSAIVYARSRAKKLLARKKTHEAEFGNAHEGITEAMEHINQTISGHRKAVGRINEQLLAMGHQDSWQELAMLNSDVANCNI